MISLIIAIDKNFGIGKDNQLPWGKIPADMKHFREKTLGKTVVMGRKTFESIGHALPERTNIVLTRDEKFSARDITVVHSTDEAIDYSKPDNELMIIGGSSIYKDFLPVADRIYLTLIDGSFDADTYFPIENFDGWKLQSETKRPRDEKNPYDLVFRTYER